MNNKICETCALYAQEQSGCVRTKTHVRPSDTCSYWTDELMTCDICGQMFIPPANYIMEENSDKVVIACHNCFAHRGSCQTCQHSYCAFQEDTTCKKGCPCYSDEGCNKQCGTCGNYCMKGVVKTDEVSEVQGQ